MSAAKKHKADFFSQVECEKKLRPVTVRLPDSLWRAVKDISSDRNCSMAELVRQLVKWAISDIDDYIINEKQMSEIRAEIMKLTDIISQIQRELSRIGSSFNQLTKLRNIQQKYQGKKDFDKRAAMMREMEEAKKDSKTLNKAELESLMARYEEATRKAGEAICLILR